MPGMRAALNRSPMETFKTLPNRISTTDGGMIWPSVPEPAMIPVANFGEYPDFNMIGKLINPIVMTVAPTIPVDAANIVPTKTTDIANPPLILPNNRLMVTSKPSAMPDFSSTKPMKINIGTDNKT